MSYLNDPREMAIRPESGITLEQDNRVETMYHWGARVLDLCDLPVEEYMKNPFDGGINTGETPSTEEKIVGVLVSATEPDKDNNTTITWSWNDTFTKSVKTVVRLKLENTLTSEESEELVSAIIDGNSTNKTISIVKNLGENMIFKSYALIGVGSTSTDDSKITSSAYTEDNYTFVISDKESDLKTKFTVNFYIDGELKGTTTVDYGKKVTKNIPSTAKTGYEFSGWNPPIDTVITKDTDFNGSFKAIEYTITWDVNGDTTLIPESKYTYGETIVYPNTEGLVEGYDITGWTNAATTMPAKNLVMTAKLLAHKHLLSFVLVDGDNGGDIKVVRSGMTNYGTKITMPSISKENGYSYTDWESDSDYITMPDKDVRYESQRTANEYILSYFVDKVLEKEVSYKYKDAVVPFVYTKKGYTVSKWTGEPATMPYKNVSAYCTTTINKYEITFVDENEKVLKTITVDYGTNISEILPSIEGCTYIPNDDMPTTVPDENITIKGIVKTNDYTVIINGKEEKLPYGTNIKDYINKKYPAENGYHNEITITPDVDTVPANNNVKVVYEAKPNKHILTIIIDKVVKSKQEVEYGSPLKPYLTIEEREGYTFNGWDVDVDWNMPDYDITANGSYSIIKLSMTVNDAEDNVIYSSSTIDYGTKFSEVFNNEIIANYVTTTSANGYTVEWEGIPTEDVVKTDLTISAKLVPNKYVLAFYNEDKLISSALTDFNSTIIYPTVENMTSGETEYRFVWDDSTYSGKTMPNHDVTIKGHYEEIVESTTLYAQQFLEGKYEDSYRDILVSFELNDALKGIEVSIQQPVDEELKAMVDEAEANQDADLQDRADEFKKTRLYPYCIFVPKKIDETKKLQVFQGQGEQIMSFLANVIIDNTDYVEYISPIEDGAWAVSTPPKDLSVIKVTLIEK